MLIVPCPHYVRPVYYNVFIEMLIILLEYYYVCMNIYAYIISSHFRRYLSPNVCIQYLYVYRWSTPFFFLPPFQFI